jgi:hypothetical protein
MLPAGLQAGDVTLAWDPNSESNLAGYKLYYDGDSDDEMYRGTGASEGDSPVVIYLDDLSDADSPTFTLTGLENGQYYYFVLTAFDTDGLESDFSDEVGTLIESETALNKAVDNSSDTSSGSETDASGESGGSGGSCFISGVMDGGAGNLPLAGMVVLFLMAATAIRAVPILNRVRTFHRKRKKSSLPF